MDRATSENKEKGVWKIFAREKLKHEKFFLVEMN